MSAIDERREELIIACPLVVLVMPEVKADEGKQQE